MSAGIRNRKLNSETVPGRKDEPVSAGIQKLYSEAVPGWKDESVSAGIRKLHCEAVLDAGPALCPVITATWDREEVWLYTQKSFAVCEKNFFYRP